MREIIDINYNWLFNKEHHDEHITDYNNVSGFEKVDLPHNAVDISYNYFNESKMHIDCTYKKEIFIKEEWQGKIINIIFEGVSNLTNVFVGDEFVMTHKGGYTNFKANITDYVKYGQTNMITVFVDSHENVFVPPYGGVVDYLGYSGIYREVSLEVLEQVHIKDCFIRTYDPVNSSFVSLGIELSSEEGSLEISILDKGEEIIYTKVMVNSKQMDVNVDIGKKVLWDLENPYLYKVIIKYYQNDNLHDEVSSLFGFREAVFKEDGFYLNNVKTKIRGLNRHQSYPYVGYAMPKNIQAEDADILKFDLGVNMVRCSHYPQSTHFLNRCDEIGLLVFEEIPGWQHIGNDEWKELSYKNVKDMIKRDRNHPSIVLWGVRINESDDNHDFYKKTNEIAHTLDNTRQTGGVRNLQNSELLEDVYTYNDFSFRGDNKPLLNKKKVAKKVPYLVTEFNGHMFPAKRFDNELHRLEHAIRHLEVINAAQKDNNKISGAIGWCMNDYNTHQEFGSGDQVCYHGVLDMFRIPKLASYVYASQQDKQIVLELSSNMDIGEYPAGDLDKVYAFTNCDYIKLYKNNEYVKTFYPSFKQYPNLKHPPIIIDDFIGGLIQKHEDFSSKDSEVCKKILKSITKYGSNLPLLLKLRAFYILKKYHLRYSDGVQMFYKYIGGWGSKTTNFRIEGYIGEEKVKTILRENNKEYKYMMEMKRKTLEISSTYDALRVVVRKVNQNGETIPYSFDAIKINVSGSIDLIGPSLVNLQGGAIAFWVKTNGNRGIGTISIKADKEIMETIMVK